jgi:hypothetical protein
VKKINGISVKKQILFEPQASLFALANAFDF